MKEFKADIAIISAGTAGLAAAVTAAEGGASVIAFEKSSHPGGTAIRGNGPFAVESRLQRLKQYTLTREDAFKIYMDFTQWCVNARLVKAFIDKSASTLEWLEKMGVEFYDIGSHGPGMYYTWHLVKEKTRRPGLGAAATMMDIMYEKAKNLGVKIYLQTPVKQILAENGCIIGLVAEDNNKQKILVKAGAVITASGGFGGHFRPPFGIPGLLGEGIGMAKEIGADTSEGNVSNKNRSSGGGGGIALSVVSAFAQPNLLVNLLGERFMDEEVRVISPFGNNAISLQKNQCAFSIFDEETKRYYAEIGLDFVSGFGIAQLGDPVMKVNEFDAEIEKILNRGSDSIFAANSIEELAVKTGIKKNGLRKTVEEYNLSCDTGRDKTFNKKSRYLRPVRTPKFYASRILAFPAGNLEGIKINHRTEVLTKDHEIIPGLYAAGMDTACNIYRDVYPNILPGNAMGYALNTGRIAAESALEYIQSIEKRRIL
jgi:fumarate reductase flavoprotein subunit